MSGFVHLHLHTEYSLLDGATRISTIADKAIKEGQSAVAITDHGVMYGVVDFYKSLKEKGIKPIIGCEVYVASGSRFKKDGKQDLSGYHLILLCKNEIGYRNLCFMVSEGFTTGFYSRPRIDFDLLKNHHEGLIALSACIGGEIPQHIISGSMDLAEGVAKQYKDLFGDDFYLEIQNHGIEDERRVAFGLKLISEKLDIPLVATNDVHYLEKSDAEIQATLMCVQTNNVLSDGRPLGFETDEFYFKSTEEMYSMFSAFPGACENTERIAEKCDFDFTFNQLHLPDFKPENGLTHAEKIRKDAYEGFESRIKAGRFDFEKNDKQIYLDRIEYELSVIDKMGFNAYFLIVADFVKFAKSRDIPVGPGRGSGAGSLVAFCIGITDVDPIAFDLLFERFLNPERVTMPDFDIDFCYIRRDEVIDYVKRKYGEDKVAQIVTFGTLAPRAAIRDVGRALGMSYSAVDTVAKMIPRDSTDINMALENKELHRLYISDNEVRRLIDVSRGVEGMPRHASTHAAGVVITEKPTYEYVPLAGSGTGVVTQFDMNTDADLGLVKFDFLGLRYITVIHDAVELIKKKNPKFSIDKIPLDDRKTFKLLCDARTDGVFQLESGGMKAVLTRLSPSCLEDIIATVALFRPGPMDSIDTFIARKHGREKTTYKIPALAKILDVTYGCIVYQEQVMQICRNLAGYSYARADIVRRAMSKKKTTAMQAEREDFISGCLERGVSREDAIDVFEEMVGFAKYAFNKSHATAYAVISYRTAYLKAHYPAEYFSALLSSVLSNSSALKSYIADAQRFGVQVLPPDINKSGADFTVTDGGIRFGLLAIKNVGRVFADGVVKARGSKPFSSFDEFVDRINERDLNKRTLESMIKCGAFDSLGVTRSSLMACYENIIESCQQRNRRNISGQIDMFSMAFGEDTSIESGTYEYPNIAEFPLRELLLLEKESSGMYFSGHMIDNYSKCLESIEVDKIGDIVDDFNEDNASPNLRYKDRSNVKIAGIITAKKTKATKSGENMAFITLEDRYGEIVVVVFVKQYKAYESILRADHAVLVEGSISADEGEAPEILLSSAEELLTNEEYVEQKPSGIAKNDAGKNIQKAPTENKAPRLYIKVSSLSDRRIDLIYRFTAFCKGYTEIVLFDESTGKYSLLKSGGITPTDKVLGDLKKSFGDKNVILK